MLRIEDKDFLDKSFLGLKVNLMILLQLVFQYDKYAQFFGNKKKLKKIITMRFQGHNIMNPHLLEALRIFIKNAPRETQKSWREVFMLNAT